MRINSTWRPKPKNNGDKPKAPSAEKPEAKTPKAQTPWRDITLDEATVEIPQSILELTSVKETNPRGGMMVQGAVSGLAALRAVQCFHDAESLEEVMEGVSSAALAAAGGASLFPGAAAVTAESGFLLAHGATELALGIREITEEARKDKPAKLELAAGVLDSLKGASTFLPLIAPSTGDAVNIFQIGAILTKTVMEPFMERNQGS